MLKDRIISMTPALEQLGANKILVTLNALEKLHTGPYFPKYLLPRQAYLVHESGQLHRQKVLVFLMVLFLLSVRVNVDFGFKALYMLLERARKQALALLAESEL